MDLTFPDIKSIAHGFGNTDSEDEDIEAVVKNDGITLGHLLQSVFVSAPELSYRNIAFLDTPGYSKPDSSSYSAKTDERIARAQLNSSNYILWFVPADTGTITKDDVDFLDSLDKSISKLIIITKADKAPNDEELEKIRKNARSVLDVKGIRYEDVLLFSRKKGKEYDRAKVQEYLKRLDGAKQEVDFARSFKKLFVECRKFYDDTLKEKERWLSRLNRALTYDGDNDDVRDCLTDVTLDVKEDIKELKSVREYLDTLKVDFFTEIKRVADCVHIQMPEPSEIDLLENSINNPANVLKGISKAQNRRSNEDLVISRCKRLEAPWSYGMGATNADLSSTAELIKVARHKNFNDHFLKGMNDHFLKRAYIVLLMSVARVNAKSPASLLYPCSIAVSCRMEESIIDECVKESMILIEKEFSDYAKVLSAKNVRDMFVFDALSMVCVHDAGDEEKLAYVAGLAILLGISDGEIGEVLLVVDCLLGGKDTFECKCRYIDAGQFRNMLLAANKNIFYETAQEFYLNFNHQVDFTRKLPKYITGKDHVFIRNIYISGAGENLTYNLRNCNSVIMEECLFKDMEYYYDKDDKGLFYANNVRDVKFSRCRFKKIFAHDGPYTSRVRVIGNFDATNRVMFENVDFSDCISYTKGKTRKWIDWTDHRAMTNLSQNDKNYVEKMCTYNNSASLWR